MVATTSEIIETFNKKINFYLGHNDKTTWNRFSIDKIKVE
jgi:hypothetical protein